MATMDLAEEVAQIERELQRLEARFGVGRSAVSLPPRSAPVEHGDPVAPAPVVLPRDRVIYHGRLGNGHE